MAVRSPNDLAASVLPANCWQRGTAIDAVLVGLAAALLGWAGSWIPWPWPDEGATLSAVTRPLPQLVQLVIGRIDAVHALYYLIAHAWIQLFGPNIASIRTLSALAAGAGAAGVVVLGRRLGDRRFSLTAGVVFALLPQTLWSAAQARSYAMFAAMSVWMTLSLLVALQHGRRYWTVYALVTAVGVYLFVLLLLVPLAHLITLGVLRRPRRHLVQAAVALTCAFALSSPVLLLAARQRYQVGWIRDANLVTMPNVFEYQWFGYSLLAAGAGWLMIASAVLVPLLLRRARPRMTAILAVGLPWLVVPTSVLLLTTLVKPLYVARYALVSSPAVALVIAGALTLARLRVALVALTLFGLAVAPEYLRQRQVEGNGYDWGSVSSRLSRLLSPTDAVYVHPDLPMTAYRILYPDVVGRYHDPSYLGPPTTNGGLWDTLLPPVVAARRATHSGRVALIEDNSDPGGASQDLRAFREAGFILSLKSAGYSTDLYVLERPAQARPTSPEPQ